MVQRRRKTQRPPTRTAEFVDLTHGTQTCGRADCRTGAHTKSGACRLLLGRTLGSHQICGEAALHGSLVFLHCRQGSDFVSYSRCENVCPESGLGRSGSSLQNEGQVCYRTRRMKTVSCLEAKDWHADCLL